MWDLEAKLSGKSVWSMVGVSDEPVETVYTIGIEEDPEAMGEKAAKASQSLLKIKLDSDRPVARIEAIRKCRPDARLTADANQGWSFEQLKEIAAAMQKLGVRSEEHTSELQSLMRSSYDVFCLKQKNNNTVHRK